LWYQKQKPRFGGVSAFGLGVLARAGPGQTPVQAQRAARGRIDSIHDSLKHTGAGHGSGAAQA
jgi:hypothetical protein